MHNRPEDNSTGTGKSSPATKSNTNTEVTSKALITREAEIRRVTVADILALASDTKQLILAIKKDEYSTPQHRDAIGRGYMKFTKWHLQLTDKELGRRILDELKELGQEGQVVLRILYLNLKDLHTELRPVLKEDLDARRNFLPYIAAFCSMDYDKGENNFDLLSSVVQGLRNQKRGVGEAELDGRRLVLRLVVRHLRRRLLRLRG
ncbi:hypothetical protein BJ508DRAFT_308407 [Ascobolus immersus RN42]|uniref:Uncharacterized protein n=1 Tax=Ascobolus immersus RN42 TaxID=1160509 RepID=A0A3N4HZM6_ASCIM|nr:hypothetical protein BJ508DRAFT_308407 [Ascobolus immersus RN42]